MAKAKAAIKAKIKLQCPGGQATPAPPVGPALGAQGVNIADFVRKFNDATREANGMIIPVEITVFEDRTYTFILKSPPASVLLKKAAGIASGAKNALKEVVGEVTKDQVREIVKTKFNDLNTTNVEAAMRIIEGTARTMGIKIKS